MEVKRLRTEERKASSCVTLDLALNAMAKMNSAQEKGTRLVSLGLLPLFYLFYCSIWKINSKFRRKLQDKKDGLRAD